MKTIIIIVLVGGFIYYSKKGLIDSEAIKTDINKKVEIVKAVSK